MTAKKVEQEARAAEGAVVIMRMVLALCPSQRARRELRYWQRIARRARARARKAKKP
jgi:hypothetical protein